MTINGHAESWRAQIERLDPSASFSPPASATALNDAQRTLGLEFPLDLRDLLIETDGVRDRFDSYLIWPLERLLARRASLFQADYDDCMPLDVLLFFADSGAGELFGYSINRTGAVGEHIYVWHPITDDRVQVARSLRGWIEGWLGGTMSV